MKAKKTLWYYAFALIGATVMLFSSCKKDDDDKKDDDTKIVKDIDGNVYKTVIIGNQEWFAENLRTTKYNDGTMIPTGHSYWDWTLLTSGAYAICPHSKLDGLNSDSEVLETYGALYNWYAVNTGKLCPKGWRVPTDADWMQLINYFDPTFNPGNNFPILNYDDRISYETGGKLKSTRTDPVAHPRWKSPNTGATDEYGFSALPGGYRFSYDGDYHDIDAGFWWSSSEVQGIPWFIYMEYLSGDLNRFYHSKINGLSVRCMRDN